MKNENNIPNIAPIDADVHHVTHFSAHAAVKHKFNLFHETINYHYFTEAKESHGTEQKKHYWQSSSNIFFGAKKNMNSGKLFWFKEASTLSVLCCIMIN